MDLEDKFRGAMLGGALGDAIGELAFGLGDRATLTAAVDRRPSLVYTDDTAMAIGVAEVLVAHGGLDPETLCRRFHDNYRREPWRGYPRRSVRTNTACSFRGAPKAPDATARKIVL